MSTLTKSAVFSPTKGAKAKAGFSSPNSPTISTAKTKPSTPAYLSKSKQSTSTSFFKKTATTAPKGMTMTTYYTPKNLFARDIAILHESKQHKMLETTKSSKPAVPRRDPILQNNQEPCHEFKPSVRRLASADRLSECKDELFRRSRKTGEFNHVYNPQVQSPKESGIKTFVTMPSPSRDENPRRLQKGPADLGEVARNPITEGDLEGSVYRRSRGAGSVSDHQQKLNDRVHFMPADRGRSCRGRVFRDSTFTLGDETPTAGSQTERSSRPMTAQHQKMRGSIKEVIEYDECPNMGDHHVTEKATQSKFRQLVTEGNQLNDRVFARKKTLDYQ